jgi:hypothetical protein
MKFIHAVLLSAFLLAACSEDADESYLSGDAGAANDQDASILDAGGTETASSTTDDGGGGTCRSAAVAQTHASDGSNHVASNAGVIYNSNPPSSGPHCAAWGRYAVYTPARPLPRCNYVHNLEHGAVVLLYRCAGGCPEIVKALEDVRAATSDPDCRTLPRVIVTADPDLDTTVAAAAWQATWKSDCLDETARESLRRFITDHLGTAGVAPEARVCADGTVTP